MSNSYGVDVEAFFQEQDLFLVRSHARLPRYCCPFGDHDNDRADPGFVVDLTTGCWWCFKCLGDSGEMLKGNLITFVERYREMDRSAARSYLVAQHCASFGRRVEPDPANPFSPAARRARGQVVSGKKPGSTRFALRIKEREIQRTACGQKRVDLRRWIESEFGVTKRYANTWINSMLIEGLLFDVRGAVYGSFDDAREATTLFLDEANCPPQISTQEIAHQREEIAHPVEDPPPPAKLDTVDDMAANLVPNSRAEEIARDLIYARVDAGDEQGLQELITIDLAPTIETEDRYLASMVQLVLKQHLEHNIDGYVKLIHG